MTSASRPAKPSPRLVGKDRSAALETTDAPGCHRNDAYADAHNSSDGRTSCKDRRRWLSIRANRRRSKESGSPSLAFLAAGRRKPRRGCSIKNPPAAAVATLRWHPASSAPHAAGRSTACRSRRTPFSATISRMRSTGSTRHPARRPDLGIDRSPCWWSRRRSQSAAGSARRSPGSSARRRRTDCVADRTGARSESSNNTASMCSVMNSCG